MTCIITGCALSFEGRSNYAWGELHLIGNCFVFNANTEKTPNGETAKWYDGFAATTVRLNNRRRITIKPVEDWFERRGVYTVLARQSMLSPEAQQWIGEELLKKVPL